MVRVIGSFLKQNMPTLDMVLNGWPESNVTMDTPYMAITVVDPGYAHQMNPYEYKGEPQAGTPEKYDYMYVHGEYNASLQLDIMAESKVQRWKLLQEFQAAMLLNWPDLSLLLPMENYYDIICRYDFENYNFDNDSELASQTKEWRVKIDMLGHCKAVHTREEFAILDTEIDVENVNTTVEIE